MVRLSGTVHGLVSWIQPEHSTEHRRSLQGVARRQILQDGPTTYMNTPDTVAVHSRELSQVQAYHAQTFGLDHQTGLTCLQQDGLNNLPGA